jgi:hypothetical protein
MRSCLTKRVPQDQGQLWNLFPLLAELQQRGFPGILVEEVGNVLEGTPVVLGYRCLQSIVLRVGRCEVVHVVDGAGDTVVVLLLGHVGGGGGGLCMVLVRILLVHPGRIGLWILMVSVDVRVWHHFGSGRVGAVVGLIGGWAVGGYRSPWMRRKASARQSVMDETKVVAEKIDRDVSDFWNVLRAGASWGEFEMLLSLPITCWGEKQWMEDRSRRVEGGFRTPRTDQPCGG